jgi:hypothetical protein
VRPGFESITDDRGTDLLEGGWEDPARFLAPAGALHYPVELSMRAHPAEGATRLRIRGSVSARYVLERKSVLTIDSPAPDPDRGHAAEPFTLRVRSVERGGGKLRLLVNVSWKGRMSEFSDLAPEFAVRDSKDEVRRTSIEFEGGSWGSGEFDWDLALEAGLPDGVDVKSLELSLAKDSEEVLLPFDFGEIPWK